MRQYFVYILGSKTGTLYVGMTNDLKRRVFEHKNELVDGFSKKYKCKMLLCFEQSNDIKAVSEREKQLKKWSRIKKVQLIKNINPNWEDLSITLEMTNKSDGMF